MAFPIQHQEYNFLKEKFKADTGKEYKDNLDLFLIYFQARMMDYNQQRLSHIVIELEKLNKEVATLTKGVEKMTKGIK